MTAVTTLLDKVFAVLAGTLSPSPAALRGRVVDSIGLPVGGAVVRAATPGRFGGEPLARAVVGPDGTFALVPAAGVFPPAYELVVEAGGVTRRIAETRPVPLAVGDVRILLPLRLTASVGDGGENRAVDVRRVQDRLLRLGRLTEADLADPREFVVLDGPVVPRAPGPRTMAALAEHLAARFGRRLPVTRVEAYGPTLAALADDGPAPRAALGLSRPVGLLPGIRRAVPANLAADVTAVQERLNQLGFLTLAEFRAERNPAVALTRANKPHTLDAIRDFDDRMAAGSLQAIAHEGLNGRLLDDPWCWGRRPLRLVGSVGAGGRNHRADVERAQDRLVDLGLLTAAQRDGERAAFALVPPDAPIADGMIPATIAALRTLRVEKLGEADPAGLVDPVDTALRRLNHPPRVELSSSLPAGEGWSAAEWKSIHPAGLRQLQDRLLLLGFLTHPEFEAEKVDPHGGGVDAGALGFTRRALAQAAPHAGPLALEAAVGQGAANRPPDVHLLQDRLLGLGFLSPEAHARERVDPVRVENLADTFGAITAVRQRVFALPAPQAGAPWTALPVIQPGDETHRFLSDPLFFGRVPLALSGAVGRHGWNFPADVRAVQDRLREMRLLTDAEVRAEPLVDPDRATRVAEGELPSTRAALGRLRAVLLGEAAPAPARVDALSPAAAALDDRLGALRLSLSLAGSVGEGGANAPADVRRVQHRLNELGFLADDAFRAESDAVRGAGEGPVADALLPGTIAAIGAWRRLMLGEEEGRRIEPRSLTHLTLEWPRIPRRVELGLTAGVGPRQTANEPNLYADVRRVQDRLFELGMMPALDYFLHRVDGALPGAVPDADMGPTADAIERLQETLAGVPGAAADRRVNRGGRSQRVMEDPSFSTPTIPNPYSDLEWAGPAALVNDNDLLRCMLSLEAQEGGNARGEIPAVLRNASWTPASWGAAQMTAATAVNELRQAGSAAYRAFYGLTLDTLAELEDRAVASGNLYDDHTAGTVEEDVTEQALTALIQAPLSVAAEAERQGAGFDAEEVERMFRAGQLRRHILAARQLQPRPPAADLLNPAAVLQPNGGQALQPHAADNIGALRLSENDVQSYLGSDFFEENRQGFATRALFWSPQGQVLRNLLTDDSGNKMGRFYISTLWARTANRNLPAEQRVRITAYMHNVGTGTPVAQLVGQLANPQSALLQNQYATEVVARWHAMPVP